MSKKNSNSIVAHFRELLLSKGISIQYVATVSIMTVLGTILGAYIQISRGQILAITIYPIVLPIAASYWLAAYLTDSYFFWMMIYVVISIVIYSFLFLPVLIRRKFNTDFALIIIQISIIVAYILINHKSYQVFIMWMSV